MARNPRTADLSRAFESNPERALVDWFKLLVEEHEDEPFDVLHAHFLSQAGFVATYAGKYLHLPRNNALAESLNLMRNAGSSARVISFAGELREKKGLRLLLNAYARVNEKQPATLLIVGDIRAGEDRQIFEEFKRSNPNTRIIITGFVSQHDLPVYYSLMDIFLQPSLGDGLPKALLEAMACEKAVIGAPFGGIIDVLTDCENRRLVSTNDPNELANVIDELLANEGLRIKLGSAGRQTILENFTLQAELEANLALYRRLGLKM